MTSPTESRPRGRVTGPVVIAVTGTLGLAAAAFVLSFTALRDLATLSGIPEGQSWLWPLVVDGVILEATISVVALRDGARAARRFAWLLLCSGAGISVAANITHAVVIASDRVPGLIAAFVASVPPLTLVAMTHLTVELIRDTTPPAQKPRPQASHPVEVGQRRATGNQDVNTQPAGDAQEGVETTSDAEQIDTGQIDDGPVLEPAVRGTPQAAVTSAAGGSRAVQRATAIELATDPGQDLSFRQIAERVGVHPTTVGRWVSAPDGQPPAPEPVAADGRTDDEPHT